MNTHAAPFYFYCYFYFAEQAKRGVAHINES